ncbi:MAG: hypothetical protein II951_13985 [Bacteroidales bacterium]|jgi:uncharacterized phage infection (PIP) family protein YhgE|nr:hypothetical protein [Bacteroidales bacterium]
MKKYLIAGVAVAVIAIATLSILLFQSRKANEEMTAVFVEEKQQLVEDYEDLYLEYDDMKTDNDSLSGLLEENRARVAQLTEELQTLRASNARRIKELQEELTTLRTVARSFIAQIDSLNACNKELTKENKEMRNKLEKQRKENADLQQENSTLAEKVTVASRLEANGIVVTGLTVKDKETSRIGKIAKLRTSFKLAKNISAQVGMRTMYVRIMRPDGELLMHSKQDKFKFEDTELNFSAQRQVEYGGDETETYVIYTVDSGELMAGEYDVEIFAEGDRIGGSKFKL